MDGWYDEGGAETLIGLFMLFCEVWIRSDRLTTTLLPAIKVALTVDKIENGWFHPSIGSR